MLKISEAKEKICPINQKNCIADKCPKWEFTKTRIINVFAPKWSCPCSKQTAEYRLCFSCGQVSTEEYADRARKEIDLGELPYEEKEGYCTL